MMKTMTIRVDIIFLDPPFRLANLELDLLKSPKKKNVYIASCD